MLPGIHRWTDAEVLDRAADTLAKLCLGACDKQKHGNPLYESSTFIGYPTRKNVESWVRTALTPKNEIDLASGGRGIHPRELCGATWDRIDADPGEDFAAMVLLDEMYERIINGETWYASPEQIDRAVFVLASFDPESLWFRYVTAAWPDHPQTPGSAGWNEAEEKGNPHETVSNPFLDRR